jgi:hypothetical protein
MAEASRVTFKLGGVKRPVLNNVASSTSQFDSSTISNNDQREIVTGFDNGEIKSNTSSEAKKELVITSQPCS